MTFIKDLTAYLKESFGTVLLVLIVVSIPFKIIFGSIATIGALLYSIYIVFFTKKVPFNSFNSFAFWFPVILFSIAFFSAITSKNYEVGLDQLFKRLSVLFLPFILFSLIDRKTILKKLLIAFSVTTTFVTVILIGVFIVKYYVLGIQLKDLIFHNYSALFNQHPVYFSLYTAFSIFIVTKNFIDKEAIYKNAFISILSITVLLVGIILASSKAVLAAFSVLFIIFLLLSIKTLKLKIIIIGLSMVGVFSVLNFTHINKRFTDGLLTNNTLSFKPSPNFKNVKTFSSTEKRQISDLELRYIFFKVGFCHTIYDNKYWFGYGLGDVQDNLDYYYMKYNLAPSWYEGYNLHNQYLQIFVTYGVFSLLLFLSYISYSLFKALKNKDILYVLFLGLMLFVFTFEVLLARNKGMVFFYFFNTLFLINNIKFENSHTGNQRYP